MIKLDNHLNTDGQGYWSNQKRAVRVVNLRLGYVNDEHCFGELRVYFDTRTWSIARHGLIYTDRKFERELRALLRSIDLDPSDLDYSEQGMQGVNYVSFDVGPRFLASFIKKKVDWPEFF